MYLIVFVTLAISLISTYTQVLAIEISRVANSQTAIAQQMLAWHTGAVSMAASVIDTNSSIVAAGPPYTNYNPTTQASGCELSNHYPVVIQSNSPFAPCPGPILAGASAAVSNGEMYTISPQYHLVPLILYKQSGKNECVHLPSTTCTGLSNTNGCVGTCTTNYDGRDYEFYSILFQYQGTDYVVTFAPPATDTSSNIRLGGGNTLSLTGGDLLHQLSNLHTSNYTFGKVIAGTTAGGGNLSISTPGTTYTNIIPAAASVPLGSVAIIGFPDGF